MFDPTNHPFLASYVPDGGLPVDPQLSGAANRLMGQDRVQVLNWALTHANPVGALVEIRTWQSDDAAENGEYIGIYRAHEPWLVWGLARYGDEITVWNGPGGSDLGAFTNMKDALAALENDLSKEALVPRESAEQLDGDSFVDITVELNALESAIIALAQKAQKVDDASQRRGDRIDAMLAKIDETIAQLTRD